MKSPASSAAITTTAFLLISTSQSFAPVAPSRSGTIVQPNNNDVAAAPKRRHFLSSTLSGGPATTTTERSVSFEEDLELTRQIIMKHIERLGLEDEDGIFSNKDYLDDDFDDGDLQSSSASLPQSSEDDYPQNDLMIRAALGQQVERTPTWLFRQAGRHLPEYQSYKERINRNFLEMLRHPADVAECTLQPCRRYGVDAAILFSDILVVPEALGVEVTMPGGVGIQVPVPLVGPADMKERMPSKDDMDVAAFVDTKLGHVMESVRLIRSRMRSEGISIPLIGFSAAPWTLMYYMVGGSSKKNQHIGMEWLREHSDESRELMDLLTTIVIEYMAQQVENGTHMLQLFEAMGMMIEEKEFDEFALPCLEKIAAELKERYPDVPLMVFARGASFANEALSKLGYDVITIDGSVDRVAARDIVGGRAGLQGNYDPAELIAANGKTVESVRESVKEYLGMLGPQRLIANLGEGLGGKESPELVNAFVESIHEESERMIQEGL